MKKYKYEVLGKGKRPNEEIIAILDEKGRVDKVASAYFDHKRNIYRLYPTNYGSYSSIRDKMSVSLYDVKLG
ncbi:MAG: hypothetical protein IJ445_06915 [Clostridia bacterium]|nr:hypothetical protein [Clostridia bacterium]